MRYEFLFFAVMALAMLAGNAHATDSLEVISGPYHQKWTGNLLTLRWGTHQIEFEGDTIQNWTDTDGGFGTGFEDQWAAWVIDVQYNHRLYHIPMLCSVTLSETHPGQYDVVARCRG
jgi:hypothetical protein